MSVNPVLEEGNKVPEELARQIRQLEKREPPPTRNVRLALGLTLLREVDAKVVLRWLHLMRLHWWPGPVYNGRGQYTVQARNLVLHQAFQELDEWNDLLFWDADQIPPLMVPGPLSNGWPGGWFTDYLDWLAKKHREKKVIGGLYFSREDYWQTAGNGGIKAGPHEPIAYERNPAGGYRFLTTPKLLPMLQQPGLYEVAGVGTGSMLIRKDVLLRLRELKAPKAIFEAPLLEPGSQAGGPGSQWTEDLYFCHEVQERLGEKIWLDTAMQSAHMAEVPVTAAHYLQARGYRTEPHPQSVKRL